MIKGLILDNDGVLVDTEDLKLEVLNSILEMHTLKIAREKYYNEYVGNGEADVVGSIISGYRIPESVQDFLEEKRRAYLELLSEQRISLLLPGVHDFLRKIHKLGLPIVIATGSTRDEMQLLLPIIGAEFIKGIITQEDANFQKPNPETYLKAAEKLNLRPANIMIIEDNFKALKEAKKEGFVTVLVNRNARGSVEGADYQIKSLEEFKEEWLRT